MAMKYVTNFEMKMKEKKKIRRKKSREKRHHSLQEKSNLIGIGSPSFSLNNDSPISRSKPDQLIKY